jgi:hypothetical protein
MAVTPALQTQIAAIQARIDTLASTATPEDVVMLAKAIEAVAGQATVFDLKAYAQTLAEGLDAQIATATQGVETAATQNLLELEAAKQDALGVINASPLTLAAVHAYTLAI